MILIRDDEYENTTVSIDNKNFYGCTFKNCTLVFSGEGPVSMSHCEFENIAWDFVGAASNTISFLHALYGGMGDTGQQFVENVFDDIRKGPTYHERGAVLKAEPENQDK